MDRFNRTGFNALVVTAGGVLINLKAELKAGTPMLSILRHVFAAEKAKCVPFLSVGSWKIVHFYSVQIRKNNHLRNVRGLLARQLLKLLHLYSAPFQHHPFCAETTAPTYSAQLLPERHRYKYIVLARQKERARLLRMSRRLMRTSQTLRITIYAQRIALSCWSNLRIVSTTAQSPRLYGLAVSSAIRESSQLWLKVIQTFLSDMITLCRLYR